MNYEQLQNEIIWTKSVDEIKKYIESFKTTPCKILDKNSQIEKIIHLLSKNSLKMPTNCIKKIFNFIIDYEEPMPHSMKCLYRYLLRILSNEPSNIYALNENSMRILHETYHKLINACENLPSDCKCTEFNPERKDDKISTNSNDVNLVNKKLEIFENHKNTLKISENRLFIKQLYSVGNRDSKKIKNYGENIHYEKIENVFNPIDKKDDNSGESNHIKMSSMYSINPIHLPNRYINKYNLEIKKLE
ncbi:hypothetical protein A3Q56_08656 [Intoshia linei]|uniref:Uncharacterized protein n=1 Tax=Intoshia linei TaxID=1819745 RepID=A0A177ANK2_9BILA|nr:hypothetical protein A3Q56_08656 [Intoshia linei]